MAEHVMVEKFCSGSHICQEMFDLVDAVEDYPGFLPWCSQTRVDFRDEKKTVFSATLYQCHTQRQSHFTTDNETRSAPRRP